MRNINSLVSLPFFTSSGVVIRPGYDEATETYANFDAELMGDFPLSPSRAELVAALRQIMRPFEAFKFATPHDKAAMLAAVIGVIARPGMGLAPGVLFDAPCPGSGKTLAAQAVGAISLGRRAPVTPFAGVDDAELKKVMVGNLLDGYDFLLLDNVEGYYDSAVMASVLTSGALRDRVLGSNLMFDGAVRMNICLTSNNASLSRDLTSRFIRVRIDTKEERPQTLEFAFDPVERALTERLAIARAVCVVMQGFFAAGSPRIGKGDARFPEWSRLVRQCVLWCGKDSLTKEARHRYNGDGLLPGDGLPSLAEEAGIGELGDPAWQILEEAGRADPESRDLGLLLHGLRGIFGNTVDGKPVDDLFMARDVLAAVEAMNGDSVDMVCESLEGLRPMNSRGPLTAKGLAIILGYRVDRICDGLVLRRSVGEKKTMVYQVSAA